MIYHSTTNLKMYELAEQGRILRQIIIVDGTRRELLYEKVEHKKEIEKAEHMSERRNLLGLGKEYAYIVLEQYNANGESTGYIKVLPKFKIVVEGNVYKDKKSDWMYYKRRNAK